MRRTSLVIISLLLCIALSVPALAAGELDAFQRTANDAASLRQYTASSLECLRKCARTLESIPVMQEELQ